MALAVSSGNNGLGINSFSGPMGQKEPAYGAVERASVLSRLAPVGSPQALNAPRRAKRAALRRSSGGARSPSQQSQGHQVLPGVSPPSAPPSVPASQQYEQGLQQFWAQMASDPQASPLVKQYAQQVLASAPGA